MEKSSPTYLVVLGEEKSLRLHFLRPEGRAHTGYDERVKFDPILFSLHKVVILLRLFLKKGFCSFIIMFIS